MDLDAGMAQWHAVGGIIPISLKCKGPSRGPTSGPSIYTYMYRYGLVLSVRAV